METQVTFSLVISVQYNPYFTWSWNQT